MMIPIEVCVRYGHHRGKKCLLRGAASTVPTSGRCHGQTRSTPPVMLGLCSERAPGAGKTSSKARGGPSYGRGEQRREGAWYFARVVKAQHQQPEHPWRLFLPGENIDVDNYPCCAEREGATRGEWSWVRLKKIG